MSRIAIVVVNWNSWELLVRCLEKLGKQTFKDFSVLVIDNASAQPEPDDFFIRFPKIKLLRNQSNLGFAAANNQAISNLVDSEWLALLNPDAFPEPDWLDKLLAAARNHPEFAAFGSRQMIADTDEMVDGLGDLYHLSGLVRRRGHGRKLRQTDLLPCEIFSPCAGAALYRRQALVEVGGFDEDFFCYVEDVDLGFRLRLGGYRAMYVPEAVVQHVGSAATGGQHSDFSVYHGHRNLVWVYFKNMPGWLFWALLPLHVTMNLVTLLVFAWRGKSRIIIQAKRDAFLGLTKMWPKRQKIQRQLIVSIGEIWRVLNRSFD